MEETYRLKVGLAEMLKGGVIMDVTNAEQASIAEKAGATPVMAKARIGHFMEARILEALGVDYIDESEVLTPADEEHHIDKRHFKVPFVCGARNLGEALRRIGIRRIGHLQVLRSRESRARHREGSDLFQRPAETAQSERRSRHGHGGA